MLLNCNINERQVMAAVGQSSKERPCSPLGRAQRRFCGQIHAIEVAEGISALPEGELERRLIELGFTEGASVEILHEGIFGRDPIAVRVNGATVALRRREAMAILVT
jgi:ferrous iron transport protein A